MDAIIRAYSEKRIESACRAVLIDRYQKDQELDRAELSRLRNELQRNHAEAVSSKRELELVRLNLTEVKDLNRVLETDKKRLEVAASAEQGKRQKLRKSFAVLNRSFGTVEDSEVSAALVELRESLMS
jgi:hypothetical protein